MFPTLTIKAATSIGLLANQRTNVESSSPGLVAVFAVYSLRALRPAQLSGGGKCGNPARADRLNPVHEALALQAGNDVIDGVASQIQVYSIVFFVTLIFLLALFWSPRALTRAAVLAEGSEVVVRHLRQDKLEFCELAPVLPWIQWRSLEELFSAEIKVTTHNYH